MTIQAMLQDAGIQHAHVVDDAFDKAPGAELRPESVQGFLQTIDDEQFNVLATLLGIPEGTEDDLIPHLNTIAGTTILYDNKDLFGDPGRILFEEFTSSMGTEKDIITPLTDFLEEAGVKCHTFGRDYQIDEHPEPQMLFVDLKLNERKILTDQPIRVVKALKEHYPDAHPLVFLMSTANVALEANQELIRDKAELLSSQFEILHKKMFTTPQDLSLFLKHHVAVYRRLCKLQEHVSAWGAALDSAKEKMLKSLRRLDLADYFILHQNTVALEQVPLGTYVADLLLEYLAHQVEASPKIWEFTKDLDDWRLSEITRSRFNLEPVVGEIFSGNVFHSFQRVASEVERKRGPADGYFNLGDVFFLSSEITNNKVKTALVVLTPACDLVRPSVLYERDGSILLCEGEVESLKPTSTFNEIDGLHPIVLQYPEIGGHQYVIKWQKKRLQTWRKPEFDSFKDRENSFWSHVGRLRPLYALQLQHLITADLSRIGVQRPPDMYVPRGIEVLVLDGDKWKILLSDRTVDPSAAAYSYSKGAQRMTFILSDVVVRETFIKLRSWVKSKLDAGAQVADMLQKLVECEGIDVPLMYYVHTLEDERKQKKVPTSGDRIFPLNGRVAEEVPKGISTSVLFALQGRDADNVYGGGKKQVAGEDGVLVFRFMKIP